MFTYNAKEFCKKHMDHLMLCLLNPLGLYVYIFLLLFLTHDTDTKGSYGLWPTAYGLRPTAYGLRPSAFGFINQNMLGIQARVHRRFKLPLASNTF